MAAKELDDFSDRLSLDSSSAKSLRFESNSEDNNSGGEEDTQIRQRKARERHECIDGRLSYELENRLTVPEEIYAFEGISELILDYNNVTEIPDQLCSALSQLKVLSVMGNRLSSLPASVHRLTQLEELFVDENRLSALPEGLTLLSQLRRLHCQGNGLQFLPDGFDGLKRLTHLKLNENQLKALPELFGHLSHLEDLDLSYNSLQALPESFGALESLRVLNISHNKLRALPLNFGLLSKIEVLELSSNDIEALMEAFASAARLRRLFLDNNCISSPLPDWFADMERLEELCLKYNRLRDKAFPERFGDVCQQLSKCDISGNLIECLPESFANLKALAFFDTGSVLFEPERRKDLRNGNNLRHLPQSFGIDYRFMKELRLDENDIEVLPHCFGDGMPALEVLDLYCNAIRVLPDSICKLKSLRLFSVGMNCLQKLPPDFGELTALEEFRAEINELRFLPQSFDQLVNLRVLDLYHNAFTAFPLILRNLENIKSLQIGLEVTSAYIRLDSKEKQKLKRLKTAVAVGVPKRTKVRNYFSNHNLHSFEDNSQLSQESPHSLAESTSGYSSIDSTTDSNIDLATDCGDSGSELWDVEDFDPERPYRSEVLAYPSHQKVFGFPVPTPLQTLKYYTPLHLKPKSLPKPSKRLKLAPVEGQFDSD